MRRSLLHSPSSLHRPRRRLRRLGRRLVERRQGQHRAVARLRRRRGQGADGRGEAFNATHPKIHVTVQNYGNADYALQKVLTAIRGGSYPDIVYLYGSWAANMARTPKAVDVAPLIKSDPSINWNDFWPAERQAVTVGDKIVGVPALVDNLALVYNKKLFDQAGLAYPTADWTWDDFRAAAKQLTDPSTKQFGWAYVNDGSEDTVWRFDALLWQAGGDILTPDHKHAAFNSPAGVEGGHAAPADGHRRPLRLPRQRQRQLRQPLQLGQDRHALHRAVGPLRLPRRRLRHPDPPGRPEPPDDLRPRPVGDARQRRRAPKRRVDVPQVVHVHRPGDAVVARHRRPADPGVADPDGRRTRRTRPEYPGIETFVENEQNAVKARPVIPTYNEISQAMGQAIQAILLGKAAAAAGARPGGPAGRPDPRAGLAVIQQALGSDHAAGLAVRPSRPWS